jgi:hypothetical protein
MRSTAPIVASAVDTTVVVACDERGGQIVLLSRVGRRTAGD